MLGALAHWPVLTRPRLAGFQVSTEALTGDRAARVILFRLENTRTGHVIERLEAVLAASSEALSRGAILIVEEARHRIRHLPIGESEP